MSVVNLYDLLWDKGSIFQFMQYIKKKYFFNLFYF